MRILFTTETPFGYAQGRLRHRDSKSQIKRFLCALCSVVNFRLPLLVSSRLGYQNLCRLITRMKLRSAKDEGAVLEDELQRTCCRTHLPHRRRRWAAGAALLPRRQEEARDVRREVNRNFWPGKCLCRIATSFSSRTGSPQSCRSSKSPARCIFRYWRPMALLCHASRSVNFAMCSRRFDIIARWPTAGELLARNSERHLKSPQEMQELFADLPEAIANTMELSSRLDIYPQRSGI